MVCFFKENCKDQGYYFTSAKVKYYGEDTGGNNNVGLSAGHQMVALVRVPNYLNVTIEAFKEDLVLPKNFHGKIMSNGDYIDSETRNVLGNLKDYLP